MQASVNIANVFISTCCFSKCGKFISKLLFFLGFRYTRHQKHKCRLLNFVVGQAKVAVYVSRRKKVEEDFTVEPVIVCVNIMKSRILIHFNFQKATVDLDSFEPVWCLSHVFCFLLFDFHLSNFTHLSASPYSFYIVIASHEIFSQDCIDHFHKVYVT